jgi:hypothetical protein
MPPTSVQGDILIFVIFSYPPFDDRIDNFLASVRRIEWTHDVPIVPWAPITNVSDPGIACTYFCGLERQVLTPRGQRNPKPPVLKATARAGADVTFHWTPIVRMHFGPVIAVGQHQKHGQRITQIVIVSRRTAYAEYKAARRQVLQDFRKRLRYCQGSALKIST